jgi:hypothetical protein
MYMVYSANLVSAVGGKRCGVPASFGSSELQTAGADRRRLAAAKFTWYG